MALIVEDGTGKADAESFCDVAFADSYHTKLGNAGWTGTTTAKEEALRKGSDYVEVRFHDRFLGRRKTRAQRLSWPRIDVVDDDGFLINADSVPLGVQESAAEAALVSIGGEDLLPNLARSTFVKRQKAGPVEREFELGAPATTLYQKVKGRLRGLLTSSTSRKLGIG